MRTRVAHVLRALCALALLAWTAGPAPVAQAQGSKPAIALLIANWTYPGEAALSTPEHDATTIRDALESAGFATEVAPNLQTRADMLAALNAFAAKAEHAEKAVVYFAGHGLETGDRYWLLPTRARLTSDTDIARSSTSLDDLVAAVAHASRLRVVIIDACRNNRFDPNWHQAEAQAADRRVVLRTIVETNDALIAYSAKLGTPALDRVNGGTNSPFATALAESLAEPGVEVSELFKSVSAKVRLATGGVQEPVAFGSGAPAGARAYFREPTLDTVNADGERFAWEQASQADTADSYAMYLRDHARGANAVEAQVRMARHLIDTAKSPPSMALTLTIDGTEALGEGFKQAAGGKSLHILLKPGNYAPEFGYSIPSDAGDILIEGAGPTPAATTIAGYLSYGYSTHHRLWLKDLTFQGTLAIGREDELYTNNVVIRGQYAQFQSFGRGRFALVGGAILADDYSGVLQLSGTTIGAVSGLQIRTVHSELAQVQDGSRLTVLDNSDFSTTVEDIVGVSESATAIFRGNRIRVPYVGDKEPRLTRDQRLLARLGVQPQPQAEKPNVTFEDNVIRLPRSRADAFLTKYPPSMRTKNTIETY